MLLKDILAHVSVDKLFFDYQTHLQSIMDKILRNKEADFNQIFGMVRHCLLVFRQNETALSFLFLLENCL